MVRDVIYVQSLAYYCKCNTIELLRVRTYYLMRGSSRANIFHFNGKTQWQIFLLLYGRHVCVPQKDTNMASPYKTL